MACHRRRRPRPPWAYIQRAQLLDEIGGVIAAVGPERDRAGPLGDLLYHVYRGQAFGMARDPGQPGIDDQAERFSISP